MLQIHVIGLGNHGQECLDRGGFAVMALEVQVHALAEPGLAQQRRQHANDFGALIVDGGRIEVVDFVILAGPRRMGQRAAIFRELRRTQGHHIGDALDGSAALVAGEFLIAIDRQPFLKAQLEPVAAGDAIAGPVVEIFVRDHALNAIVIGISGGLGLREHQLVVEDVETLVLHRAEIEIGHGHDVEDIQIIFAAKAPFIPGHGALEAIHGPQALVFLAMGAIDRQIDLAARGGGEAVRDRSQITRYQRKQIARLGEGVFPHGKVHAVAGIALFDQIAVGQQHRRDGLRRGDADLEHGQIVGSIQIIGDAAEALGLALRAPGAARAIQPHQLGIACGLDGDFGLEHKAAQRRLDYGQARRIGGIGRLHQWRAVNGHGPKSKFIAIQHQRRACGSAGVGLNGQLRSDPRISLGDLEVEVC